MSRLRKKTPREMWKIYVYHTVMGRVDPRWEDQINDDTRPETVDNVVVCEIFHGVWAGTARAIRDTLRKPDDNRCDKKAYARAYALFVERLGGRYGKIWGFSAERTDLTPEECYVTKKKLKKKDSFLVKVTLKKEDEDLEHEYEMVEYPYELSDVWCSHLYYWAVLSRQEEKLVQDVLELVERSEDEERENGMKDGRTTTTTTSSSVESIERVLTSKKHEKDLEVLFQYYRDAYRHAKDLCDPLIWSEMMRENRKTGKEGGERFDCDYLWLRGY